MKIVQCPSNHTEDHDPIIFLAGGISNCPDWQEEIIEMFKKVNSSQEIVLINPRRIDFNMLDAKLSDEQIEWEYYYLKMADIVLFWFPCETLCPITLYELGKTASSGKKIFVGCHQEYPRIFDVKKQLQLERPDVSVVNSLEELVNQVVDHVKDNWYA